MSTNVRSRTVLMLISVLLSASMMTGCAVGPPVPAVTQEVAAPAPTVEKITLEFWMQGEPGTANVLTQLIDEFMQLHPEIEVKTSFMGTELVPPALLPALNAGTGPDIFGAGTGPGQPAAIIAAGHALDLTPFYFDYGWDKIIPPTVVNYTSSDGKLWAVGDSVETTVMFYNKAIFEKYGLSVPTTWAELLSVADALKAAGFETVIGLGGLDKWPISHWQSLLWGAYAGPEGIDHVMFGDGRWDDPVFIEATNTLLKLHQAGYFGPSPLAIGYLDAITKFWRGETPMYFTGSWVIADAVSDLGDKISDFSVFAVPSPVEGKPIYVAESIGSGWYINAKTKHPREAGELLNFLFFRPESRKILLEAGHVPVGPLDLEGTKIPELLKEVFTISNTYRNNGTIHAFLDTVLPANVTEITYDGLQALLAGQMTPEQLCRAVQAAWEEAKAEGTILKPGGIRQR